MLRVIECSHGRADQSLREIHGVVRLKMNGEKLVVSSSSPIKYSRSKVKENLESEVRG